MEVIALTNYRHVGGRLGAYIRANNPSTQQIQGLLADLLAGDKLLPTMREVVTMPEFALLTDLAGSGGGLVQRDALIRELSSRYVPGVLEQVGQLIDGMLDQPSRLPSANTYLSPSRETSHTRTSRTSEQSYLDGYRSPHPQWGWGDYSKTPLPGWERKSSPLKHGSLREDTTTQQSKSASYQDGFSLRDLAYEIDVPVGPLIRFCKRMGFESNIQEDSIIPTRMALRIAITYRRSTPGLTGRLLIVAAIVILLLTLISSLTT